MITKVRLIVFIGAVVLLSFCTLYSNEKNLFNVLNIQNITAYTGSKIDGYENELSGNGYSFLCSASDYQILESEIDGISFVTSYAPQEIFSKLNLKIQSTQKIIQDNDTIQIYYCFLENLNSKYVVLDNKKVNLQIAFNSETTTLGIPLILGSY